MGRIRRAIATAVGAAVGVGVLGAVPADGKIPGRNGSMVAFERGTGATREVVLTDRAASFEQRLADGGHPSWAPPDVLVAPPAPFPKWGPQRLAFEAPAVGRTDLDLAVVRIDPATHAPTGVPEPLVDDATGDDRSPAWGPGLEFDLTQADTLVAYVHEQAGTREIRVMSAPFAGRTTLTATVPGGFGADDHPDISPSGEWVVFERPDPAGTPQLWIARVTLLRGVPESLTVGPARMVTSGPLPRTEPTWFTSTSGIDPSTDSVVHRVVQGGKAYLDVVQAPARGGEPFDDPAVVTTWGLTGDPGGDGGPSWAPHGEFLLFDSARVDRAGDIFVIKPYDDTVVQDPPSGFTPTRVTTGAAAERAPDLQPLEDGSDAVVPVAPRPRTPTRTPVGGGGGGSGGGGSGGGGSGGGGGGGGGSGGGGDGSGGGDGGGVAGDSSSGGGSGSSGSGSRPSRCTIRGGRGKDVLRGTRRKDVICGMGGNDVLIGAAGNDRLVGGPGHDRLVGGRGHDALVGGAGNDRLSAPDRVRDRLDGGSGRDRGSWDRGRDVVRSVERRTG